MKNPPDSVLAFRARRIDRERRRGYRLGCERVAVTARCWQTNLPLNQFGYFRALLDVALWGRDQ